MEPCISHFVFFLVFLSAHSTNTEDIHLPLDDLNGHKLLTPTVTGSIDLVSRGTGKAISFVGDLGPAYIKFRQESSTDAVAACFKSLSNCDGFITSFWIKIRTDQTATFGTVIIRHGPDNSDRGLMVKLVEKNRLLITFINSFDVKTVNVTFTENEWNFIKIEMNGKDFSVNVNEEKVEAKSYGKMMEENDISEESLTFGLLNKTIGVTVEMDEYKFKRPMPVGEVMLNEEPTYNFSPSDTKESDRYLILNGQNYISYNFSNKIARASKNEELQITFKFSTDVTSGLIWYSEKGLEKSFIYLKDSRLYYVYIYRKSEGGAVITASEEIFVPQILSPNKYHNVLIKRTADRLTNQSNLTLTIDESLKANKAIIVGHVPLLPPGADVFVGGHHETSVVTDGKVNDMFKGDINKITIQGDTYDQYDMIEITQDRAWQDNIKNYDVKIAKATNYDSADYLFSSEPVPFTFTEFDKLVRFSPWDFDKFESIEIQFKTKESRGVLLFVGPEDRHYDFVCLEFFDTNLYLDFGIAEKYHRVRMNPEGVSVTTGKFHSVFIKRDRNHKFTARFDNVPVNLGEHSGHQQQFGTYTYVGGFDNPVRLPWYVWSREGFVGCVNYMRINEEKYIDPRGKNNQYSGDIAGVEIGKCLNDVKQCTASICEGGRCYDRSYPYLSDKNFFCDCSLTSRSYRDPVSNIERGEVCVRESEALTSEGSSFYVVDFKAEDSKERMMKTHTDDISISFKTTDSQATIFRTFRSNSKLFFALELENGYVVLRTNINDKDDSGKVQTFQIPRGNLNDDQWHTVHIKRRADYVSLYVDDVQNEIKGTIPVLNKLRTFDNTFEYVLIGSSSFETKGMKLTGSVRNFYWNQFDFLGTRRLPGTYRGTIKTPKPVEPPLPPYPREPPVTCTMNWNHKYTKVPDIPAAEDEAGFFIEFRTQYNGVIWHGYDYNYPNDRYITLLLIDNKLVLVYNFNDASNAHIIEDGSRLSLADNTWHRVTVMLLKKLRKINVIIDKGYQPVVVDLLITRPLDIKKMEFYFGGMPDGMYKDMFRLVNLKLPRLAEIIAPNEEWYLIGCLGEFLISQDKFHSNRMSGASMTYPLNTLECGSCRDPVRCILGHCKNGGTCYQINTSSLGCNCTTTGFIGERCDRPEPRCPNGYCQNGGRCYMMNNQARCDCTNTGYRGDRCQESFCSESFCRNNGQCNIVSGRATCDCKSTDHRGLFCEIPICQIGLCKNGGRCYVHNDQSTCDCTGTGYAGQFCERAICLDNYCKNGGRCIPRNNQPTCDCTKEYTGYRCEERICKPDHCFNRGECYIYGGLPTCRCNPNYEGSRCELVKRCPLDYCSYGGSCEMKFGQPRCNCANTDYEGDRCTIPKNCPPGFCLNGGTCSVKNNQYVCDCISNYQGRRCEERKQCQANYCMNNGICSIVNNGQQCDCRKTGYSGPTCNEKTTGIISELGRYGFVVYPLLPPTKSTEDSVTIGLQTYMQQGTLYTFVTDDGKYWALRMENGKLLIDVNGRLYKMQNTINDGQYYVANIERKMGVVLVTVNGPQQESVTLTFNELERPNNEILYKQIIVGANKDEKDIFKGALGGFNWNGRYLLAEIDGGYGQRKGEITITLIPTIINKLPSNCPPNFCKNNGICAMVDHTPYCRCDQTGYYGTYCDKRTYGIFPKQYSYGGYLIMNVNPPKTTNKDSIKVLLQAHTSDNPIVRFEMIDGNFYEIKMIGGQLFLSDRKNLLKMISGGKRIDNREAYMLEMERERDNFIVYINGQRTDAFKISNFLNSNGDLTYRRIILGADSSYKQFFQGALGGFEWNGLQMIDSSGRLIGGIEQKGSVKIVLMPNFTEKIIPPVQIKKQLVDRIPDGNHGGVIFRGYEVFIPGIGIGGGAIVPTAPKPLVMGAGSFIGASVGPLIGGLLLAGLLFLSALLWACWRCKPGCCPCFSGIIHGGPALKQKILTPMQASSMATGGGRTGEKSFWSRMKSTITTPLTHNIYESGGHKVENVGLLSSGGNGMANGRMDQTDFHTTTVREERLNVNRNMGGSMHSLPAGMMYSGASNMRTARSITGTNVLDINDYRFGTIGQGSIMRIDTTHHETDVDGQMNVFSGEEMKVDCCVLSHNSRYAVTGSESGPPQVWDMQSGELFKVMDGMEVGCTDLHLACGDKILVGLVADDVPLDAAEQQQRLKRLQMWDFVTGQQIVMPINVMCSSSCVTHSSDHLIVNRESPDGSMSILCWNLEANQPVQEIFYQPPDFMNHEKITFLKVSHNDRMVVAGFTGVDGQAHYMVFDLMASYPNGIVVQPLMISFNAKVLATEVIGAEEAVTGTKKGELIVWNLRSAKPVRQILINATLDGHTQTKLNPHKDSINCVSLSYNGEYLVTGSTDQTLNVYTMQDERLLHTLEGHADDVLSVAISLDNEIIVSGSWDGSMRVWNLQTGSQMCWFTSNIEILTVKLTNDKKAIVALGERMGMRKLIMLQIIRNRTRRTRHTGGTVGSPPFSPMSV